MTKGLHKNSLRKGDNPHQWMIDDARMELIQQIKAEIERLMKENSSSSGLEGRVLDLTYEDGINTALNDVLEILSSIQEQPVCEGLEDEIQRYYDEWNGDVRYTQIARHFARWQREKDERTLRKFFNDRNQGDASFYDLLAYREGHRDGMDEQKEQMMKEAVEISYKGGVARINGEEKPFEGGTVRAIIVKED